MTVWGMSLPTFTAFHTILSLAGIATGFVVLYGLLENRRIGTTSFLVTNIATSVTGFAFPFVEFGPAHYVGFLALAALAIAMLALGRAWRRIYAASAVFALYLNVFVGVVQAFRNIGVLRDVAPQQTEPPFVIAQGVVLLLFAILGWMATARSRMQPAVV